MEKRKIEMTLDEAMALFRGGSEAMRKLLLTTFSIEELTSTENRVTKFPNAMDSDLIINGRWAGHIFPTEDQGKEHRGHILSGHLATMYLDYANGTWFTEEGNRVSGYLYWKANDNELF